MERICSSANLNRAYKRVKENKGAPGVDGITVGQLRAHLIQHKEGLLKSLLEGSYEPQAVRKVMIPKPDGGERQLGIPTAQDRWVQQAIAQILEEEFDHEFSESSFGFRPGRSAHDALKQAKGYVEEGHIYVVDMDLEKFFDRVNHDILMSRLAKKIGDKRLLKIIRRFLTAGIAMQNGVVVSRQEGTPQGGPLSPLLSNILLDEVDKELERRGHKFCRYADDQNIYVRSQRAGERVFESIKKFLETKLKLKVNLEKSAVAEVQERKFLGYQIQNNGDLRVAPKSLTRVKDKIRELTKRSQGNSFEMVIERLNKMLPGWLNYFHLAKAKSLCRELDAWIRRRLRCYKLKQKCRSIVRFLMSRGVSDKEARRLNSSGKGWWRLSHTPALDRALDNAWFKSQGLYSLSEHWTRLVNV
jgi:RNA-directed DNA polymerase